jgi:alkylhydroperoxidase family enzyme
VGSHAFFLQLQDSDPNVFGPLARGDIDAAKISEAERTLLRFVALVTRHAYRTTDEDVEALRNAGWSDPQIAECVYITALFAFFNRVADAFGLEDPNYFENPPPIPSKPGPPETAP